MTCVLSKTLSVSFFTLDRSLGSIPCKGTVEFFFLQFFMLKKEHYRYRLHDGLKRL